MVIIDLNQVILSGLMEHIDGQKNVVIEENLVRHIVLNILRFNVKRFKQEYGPEIILACDNRKYWRKEVFPFYKAGRKKARLESGLDWNKIFEIMNMLRAELKEHFPYKVLDVDRAEADDIIGTLVPRFAAAGEKILIISSDGDFIQLHRYKNVKQYNPHMKRFVTSDNPTRDLKEKIIRGDRGDGIPNILSPSDTFVRDIRQKKLMQENFDRLLNKNFENDDTVESIGFHRNQILIDFGFIPEDIKQTIIQEYENVKPASRNGLLSYFIAKKLRNLMSDIGDF